MKQTLTQVGYRGGKQKSIYIRSHALITSSFTSTHQQSSSSLNFWNLYLYYKAAAFLSHHPFVWQYIWTRSFHPVGSERAQQFARAQERIGIFRSKTPEFEFIGKLLVVALSVVVNSCWTVVKRNAHGRRSSVSAAAGEHSKRRRAYLTLACVGCCSN